MIELSFQPSSLFGGMSVVGGNFQPSNHMVGSLGNQPSILKLLRGFPRVTSLT